MRVVCWLVALLGVASVSMGSAAAEKLRGFGEVSVAPLAVGELAGYTFTCESPEQALVFMHKLGRNLEQSATVAVGSKVLVFTTVQKQGLEAAFAPAAA